MQGAVRQVYRTCQTALFYYTLGGRGEDQSTEQHLTGLLRRIRREDNDSPTLRKGVRNMGKKKARKKPTRQENENKKAVKDHPAARKAAKGAKAQMRHSLRTGRRGG